MHSERAESLIHVSMRMQDFSSDWIHCDRISSYVARMVCQNSADPLYHANLFSSVLNELLEIVFFNHGKDGDFTCRVSRAGVADVIEIDLPCDEKTMAFYTEVVGIQDRDDIADLYRAALFGAGQTDSRLGIYELAVDYAAKFDVLVDSGRLTLCATMALGGVQ